MKKTLLLLFLFVSQLSWGQSEVLLSMISEAEACEDASLDCLNLYELCITQCIKEKSLDQKGKLHYRIGRINFMMGQQEKAKESFQKGIEFSEKYEDSSSLALNYSGTGTLAFMQGQMETAMTHYLKAANIQEAMHDLSSMSHSLINVSASLYNLKDYQESLKYLFKAHDILLNEEDKKHIGTVKGNIALHYYQLKSYDSAKHWGLDAIQAGKDPKEIEASILGNYILAAVLLEKNKVKEANAYMKKAIDKARAHDLQHYLGEALGVYARILARSGKHKQASEALDEVKEIQTAYGNYLGLAQAYRVGGEVYNLSNDFVKSAEHYAKYIELYDSFLVDDVTEKVIELNKKYQAAQKEQQLLEQELKISKINLWLFLITSILMFVVLSFVLYRRRLSIRLLKQERAMKEKQLEAWFEGEHAERERLAKELHDGVASMVSAAKMSLENSLYVEEHKKEAQINRVLSILNETHQDVRMVAHDLMPISLQNKDLWEAVEDYINYYKDSNISEVEIDIDAALHNLSWDPLKKTALYRILQELVQNVYKHAHATHLSLKCEMDGAYLNVKLKDNGVGFTPHQTSGLGMKSIKDRIAYLNGEMEIHSKQQEGTSFSFRIPIKSFLKL